MEGAVWITTIAALILLTTGISAQGNVTLESLTIFRTHEWLRHKPSLYFQCKDEGKVELPDVKDKDHVYKFAGHESWQPLTNLSGVKCKRCGLYEKNEVLKDGVFDEWEFCPDGFSKEGRYTHFKDGEFNATFLSSDRLSSGASTNSDSTGPAPESGSGQAITIVVALFCFLFVAGIGVVGYAKWQKKRREEQQARFMKLFEEDDDFEREMGL